MAWTTFQVVLAILLVATGSINTLCAKWADEMYAINSDDEKVQFNHPFFQADLMFLGEMMCMLGYYFHRCYTRRQRMNQAELAPTADPDPKFPVYIFYVPAFCDMVATSTMYLGLTMTYASSFQMLRGAVIVFTGLFSVAFLGRRLRYFNWIGIVIVLAGLAIVGLADFLSDDSDMDINGVITGDLLIIAAQIVTATQMVVEEKFIGKYRVPPLKVVGWEGIFGFVTLSILLIPMYFIIVGKTFSGNPREALEDTLDAFIMIGNNPMIALALGGTVISIAFFNFAGVSVTKELSATTRMVLDSVRTLIVWLFSLIVHWQTFQYLQPIGFVVLILGMFIYNDLLFLPFCRQRGWLNDSIGEELQNEPEEVASSSHSSTAEVVAVVIEKKGEVNEGVTIDPM